MASSAQPWPPRGPGTARSRGGSSPRAAGAGRDVAHRGLRRVQLAVLCFAQVHHVHQPPGVYKGRRGVQVRVMSRSVGRRCSVPPRFTTCTSHQWSAGRARMHGQGGGVGGLAEVHPALQTRTPRGGCRQPGGQRSAAGSQAANDPLQAGGCREGVHRRGRQAGAPIWMGRGAWGSRSRTMPRFMRHISFLDLAWQRRRRHVNAAR